MLTSLTCLQVGPKRVDSSIKVLTRSETSPESNWPETTAELRLRVWSRSIKNDVLAEAILRNQRFLVSPGNAMEPLEPRCHALQSLLPTTISTEEGPVSPIHIHTSRSHMAHLPTYSASLQSLSFP